MASLFCIAPNRQNRHTYKGHRHATKVIELDSIITEDVQLRPKQTAPLASYEAKLLFSEGCDRM